MALSSLRKSYACTGVSPVKYLENDLICKEKLKRLGLYSLEEATLKGNLNKYE